MEKYLKELTLTLLSIRNENDMDNFIRGLLTTKELEEIPTRLQIVKMLKKGIPQHEIAKTLGVGIATVTRGATEIKKGRFRTVQ